MVSVFDALVITTSGYAETPVDIREKENPLRDHLDLDGVVAFHNLERAVAKAIMDACQIRGFGYPVRTHHCGQQVCIVRENPPEPEELKWDPDCRIFDVLRLSRFVRPIPVGLRYAARVWKQDGRVEKIVPGPVEGHLAYAFCAQGSRWFLTEDDAKEIKRLLGKYRAGSFPERVRRAMWRFDYTFYEQYADLRWLSLSTAMEALIHTDRYKSTKQFSVRVAALAAKLGLDQWSSRKLEDFYGDYRCAMAHGQEIDKEDPDNIRDYVDFEDLVRRILLRCIEDEAFRQMFSSDQSIRTRWPV